jgi:hypothetical protein
MSKPIVIQLQNLRDEAKFWEWLVNISRDQMRVMWAKKPRPKGGRNIHDITNAHFLAAKISQRLYYAYNRLALYNYLFN